MSMASPIDTSMKGVVWKRTLKEKVHEFPTLQGEETADLVVIGGGFCGLSIALHAAKNGLKTILLEAGIVGNGASGRNGGYAVPQFPGAITPSSVTSLIGKRKGEALCDLVVNGTDALFQQIRDYQIECSAVQNGWLQPAHSAASMERVRKAFDEWKALGIKVDWHSGSDVADLIGASGYLGGWSNATGGTVNPYGLTIGLARVAVQLGARIFENSAMTSFENTADGVVVQTMAGRVKAKMAIMATNAYTGDFLPQVQHSMVPVFLYHVATKPLSEALRRTILKTEICFTDLRKSGGFGRLDPQGRLVSGGAVFAAGDRQAYGERHAQMRMHELFPLLKNEDIEIEDYWEGYCAITDSYLPHVQRLGANVFSVAGFSTRGVNLAQNLGRVIGEFAAGRVGLDNLPVAVFEGRHDVSFWPVKARVARYIFPYYRMKDRLGLT